MAAPHSPPRSVPTTPPAATADPSPTTTSTTTSTHASIPYSADFTDALMERLLDPSSMSDIESGIRVISERAGLDLQTSNAPQGSTTLPLSAINPETLPRLQHSELPLALDDPRRRYTSAIPGVLLTHPGGFFEGGATTSNLTPTPPSAFKAPSAGPSPAGTTTTTTVMDIDTQLTSRPTSPPTSAHPSDADPPTTSTSTSTSTSASNSAYTSYVRRFLASHPTLTTPADLQRAIAAETATQLEALRERMREREDGARRNGETERKVAALVADRELERRLVWEGLKGRGREGGEVGEGVR